MAINRYSLADYTVKITFPDDLMSGVTKIGGKVITIGGPGETGLEGSFIGEIKIERTSDQWTTTGDPTGSWVHNKNLDRTGKVTLNIRQVSDDVVLLSMLSAIYEKDDRATKGLTITVFAGKTKVATAEDCYIVKIPALSFGATAEERVWDFTAGRITFKETTDWPTETGK